MQRDRQSRGFQRRQKTSFNLGGRVRFFRMVLEPEPVPKFTQKFGTVWSKSKHSNFNYTWHVNSRLGSSIGILKIHGDSRSGEGTHFRPENSYSFPSLFRRLSKIRFISKVATKKMIGKVFELTRMSITSGFCFFLYSFITICPRSLFLF